MWQKWLAIMMCFLLGVAIALTSPVVAQVVSSESQTQSTDADLVRQEYQRVLSEQGAIGISVTQVVVVGDYALLEWAEENGGGQCLFARRNGKWEMVRGVGGAFSAQELVELFKVPANTAVQLMQNLQTP